MGAFALTFKNQSSHPWPLEKNMPLNRPLSGEPADTTEELQWSDPETAALFGDGMFEPSIVAVAEKLLPLDMTVVDGFLEQPNGLGSVSAPMCIHDSPMAPGSKDREPPSPLRAPSEQKRTYMQQIVDNAPREQTVNLIDDREMRDRQQRLMAAVLRARQEGLPDPVNMPANIDLLTQAQGALTQGAGLLGAGAMLGGLGVPPAAAAPPLAVPPPPGYDPQDPGQVARYQHYQQLFAQQRQGLMQQEQQLRQTFQETQLQLAMNRLQLHQNVETIRAQNQRTQALQAAIAEGNNEIRVLREMQLQRNQQRDLLVPQEIENLKRLAEQQERELQHLRQLEAASAQQRAQLPPQQQLAQQKEQLARLRENYQQHALEQSIARGELQPGQQEPTPLQREAQRAHRHMQRWQKIAYSQYEFLNQHQTTQTQTFQRDFEERAALAARLQRQVAQQPPEEALPDDKFHVPALPVASHTAQAGGGGGGTGSPAPSPTQAIVASQATSPLPVVVAGNELTGTYPRFDMAALFSSSYSTPISEVRSGGKGGGKKRGIRRGKDGRPYVYTRCPLTEREAFVCWSWFIAHPNHPFPTAHPAQMQRMITESGLPRQKILMWFTNARRRYWNRDLGQTRLPAKAIRLVTRVLAARGPIDFGPEEDALPTTDEDDTDDDVPQSKRMWE